MPGDVAMLWLSDIRLPASPVQVRRARDVVDVLSPAVGGEFREDLRLLISEVATNAIRHGRDEHAPVPDPDIRVRLGVEADVIRVEVHDRGPGFEHVPRGPHAPPGSGWGVHFVHTLTERWGAGRDESGTWIVWFEVRLPSPHRTSMTYGQRAVDGSPLPGGHHAEAGRSSEPLNDQRDALNDQRDEYAPTG